MPVIFHLFINEIAFVFLGGIDFLILRIDLNRRNYEFDSLILANAISLVLLTATTNAARM